MLGRRAFLGGLAAVAALPALTACSWMDSTGRADSSAETDMTGLLRCRLRAPRSIDPGYLLDVAGMQICYQLFDQLMRFDYASGELSALAASGYEVNEDATEFTFHLAPARTFHDGEAVSAQSFKRAWERLVDPSGPFAELYGGISPHAHLLAAVEGYGALKSGSAEGLAGISCPDDATLCVTLSAPFADFPAAVSHPALSPIPSAAYGDAEAFAGRPVGNGPLCLSGAWEPGSESIELTRFGGYGAFEPSIERVQLLLTDDASAAYKHLEAGDLDVCPVPVEQLADVEGAAAPAQDGMTLSEGAQVVHGVGQTTYYLGCNLSKAPWDAVEFRRAVSMAIDRETLCGKILRDAYAPADGIAAPSIARGAVHAWDACAYDADQAAALLDPLHPVDDAGERGVALDLLCVSGGVDARVAESIATDLKAIGLQVKTESVPWEEAARRWRSGEFGCALMSWTPDYPALDAVAYPLFHSSGRGGANASGYADPAVDEALSRARAAVDTAERAGEFAAALDAVAAACPLIPLAFDAPAFIGASRVSELRIEPNGNMCLASAQVSEGV